MIETKTASIDCSANKVTEVAHKSSAFINHNLTEAHIPNFAEVLYKGGHYY